MSNHKRSRDEPNESVNHQPKRFSNHYYREVLKQRAEESRKQREQYRAQVVNAMRQSAEEEATTRTISLPVTNRCYFQHPAFHILFLHRQILVTIALLTEFSNCGATENGVKWHWNKTDQKAWMGLVNWWGFHISTCQPSAHLSRCTHSI